LIILLLKSCFLLPPKKEDLKFELKIFEEASAFKEAIESKNDEVGLSRIVSTFDYLHKKDKKTYIVNEEGITLTGDGSHPTFLNNKKNSNIIVLDLWRLNTRS
jgi:DUF2075 family protein